MNKNHHLKRPQHTDLFDDSGDDMDLSCLDDALNLDENIFDMSDDDYDDEISTITTTSLQSKKYPNFPTTSQTYRSSQQQQQQQPPRQQQYQNALILSPSPWDKDDDDDNDDDDDRDIFAHINRSRQKLDIRLHHQLNPNILFQQEKQFEIICSQLAQIAPHIPPQQRQILSTLPPAVLAFFALNLCVDEQSHHHQQKQDMTNDQLQHNAHHTLGLRLRPTVDVNEFKQILTNYRNVFQQLMKIDFFAQLMKDTAAEQLRMTDDVDDGAQALDGKKNNSTVTIEVLDDDDDNDNDNLGNGWGQTLISTQPRIEEVDDDGDDDDDTMHL